MVQEDNGVSFSLYEQGLRGEFNFARVVQGCEEKRVVSTCS